MILTHSDRLPVWKLLGSESLIELWFEGGCWKPRGFDKVRIKIDSRKNHSVCVRVKRSKLSKTEFVKEHTCSQESSSGAENYVKGLSKSFKISKSSLSNWCCIFHWGQRQVIVSRWWYATRVFLLFLLFLLLHSDMILHPNQLKSLWLQSLICVKWFLASRVHYHLNDFKMVRIMEQM